MKQRLRNYVSMASSYVEIAISILILISVVIASFGLIREMAVSVGDLFRKDAAPYDYNIILSMSIQLIIGIEFIKMIAKHTPGSAIEVLLFVVAKRVIIESNTSSLEVLLGVVAIAILFAVKKYLHFESDKYKDGMVYPVATKTSEIVETYHVYIPEELGDTLGEIMQGELQRLGRKMKSNEEVTLNDVILRIHSMKNGEIDRIEVVVR